MLRDIFYAMTDGFGYVIASIVGALVALTFSTDERVPGWFYIVTILVALAGAVVIALLRRRVENAFPAAPDKGSLQEGVIDEVGETIGANHGEVMAELRAMRAELAEMRRPWWHKWRKPRATTSRREHRSASASTR